MEKIINPKTSLYRKILAVQGQVGNVGQRGKNFAQKYDYTRAVDVVNAIRRACVDVGLLIHSTTLHREKSTLAAKSGSLQFLESVKMLISLIDIDTGEKVSSIYYGESRDFSDKSLYQAYTGALKSALLRLFLLDVGDDPESNQSADEKIIDDTEKKMSEMPAVVKKWFQTEKLPQNIIAGTCKKYKYDWAKIGAAQIEKDDSKKTKTKTKSENDIDEFHESVMNSVQQEFNHGV